MNKTIDNDKIDNPQLEERLAEEDEMIRLEQGTAVQEEEEMDLSDGPVPQIEIGPDGNIKINEKSLV